SELSEKKQLEAIQKCKMAHLSFFNLPVDQMKFSIVYPYYEKNDLEFLRRIEDEKMFSEVYGDEKEDLGYRITSQKLFGLEVEVLGEVIKRLNRSEEHTSELQSRFDLVCRLLLEKKKKSLIIKVWI